MINATEEGHKKLIVFADSRQDAAFQARWMQGRARRIRLRRMMYVAITGAGTPLAPDGTTDALMELFRNEKHLTETLMPELIEGRSPSGVRQQRVGAGPPGVAAHGAAGVHDRRPPHRLSGADGGDSGRVRGTDGGPRGRAGMGRDPCSRCTRRHL